MSLRKGMPLLSFEALSSSKAPAKTGMAARWMAASVKRGAWAPPDRIVHVFSERRAIERAPCLTGFVKAMRH